MTYGQDYGQQYPQHQPWAPQQYDPAVHQQRGGGQYGPQDQWSPQPGSQQAYPSRQPAIPDSYLVSAGAGPVAHRQPRQAYGLTAAQKFWYILSNIPFGAGYFAKIPAKKAMTDFGMAQLTGAEAFWYILMCLPFGAGYFAKLSTAKALSELPQFRQNAVG